MTPREGTTVVQPNEDDRKAADAVYESVGLLAEAGLAADGHYDDDEVVHIIAAHRSSSTAELLEALERLVSACEAGRMVPRPGPCGMTIEANIRASVYNGVDAWAVEEAREVAARARGQ